LHPTVLLSRTSMINDHAWDQIRQQFHSAEPFDHVIIDDFWDQETAEQLAKDYPDYASPLWNAHYQNAIEDKKACNHWDRFPATTYRAFAYLNSPEFVSILEHVTNQDSIITDVGLHGGGWHCHQKGGKLNVHLDYSIHPKLKLQRHYNLIVYMTPNWDRNWGGGLELWSHNEQTELPDQCVQKIDNRFNRSVLFDTTQHSWHGLPDDLACPDGVCRQSMAVYYLTKPAELADPRGKALFAPHGAQAKDPAVLDLIRQRSGIATAETVYKK